MALRTEGPCVFESSCCCYHHVRISGQEDPAVQAPVPCSKDRIRWATSVRTEVCLRGRGVRALGGRFQGREGCKVYVVRVRGLVWIEGLMFEGLKL